MELDKTVDVKAFIDGRRLGAFQWLLRRAAEDAAVASVPNLGHA